MMEVLFPVVVAEVLVTFLLLFRTPARRLVVVALDRIKRGRSGSILTKTVSVAIFVAFLSTIKSLIDVATRQPLPTDQLLMSRHLLHASLMGFIVVLGVIIERVHHYIREIRLLKKVMIAGGSSNNNNNSSVKGLSKHDFKAMSAEIATLKFKLRNLLSSSQAPQSSAALTD